LKKTIVLIFLLLSVNVFSQNKKPFFSDTLRSVNIDSAMAVTAKRGLSINDFTSVMLKDTMFYEAFRALKKYSFIAENKINTFDDDQKQIAKIYRKIKHVNEGLKYHQEILSKTDSGKVFKYNGDFDLFTVKMFSYIFMNENNTDFLADKKVTRKETDEEGYKEKLKTLIFTPGKAVKGVPLISDKTEIFSPALSKYYQNSFYYATYQGNIPVYYFKCKLKDNISWWNQGETMIQELTTIFDAKNMNILGRYVEMTYSSIPFDFHVKMNIEMTYLNEETLVPTHISYDGDWDIPFKKREICTFDIQHYSFK
jgi:hypothetical protein